MLKEGQIRIPSGCAISGMFSKSAKRLGGGPIIESIATMHDRSNGLGGGFAAYGIYPEYKEYYAFHIFFDNDGAKKLCECYLNSHFKIVESSNIPTRKIAAITNEPLIWRYFTEPLPGKLAETGLNDKAFVVRSMFEINAEIEGAYVFSSGKNMGVFKAVGYPEDVGEFYRLDEYKGYCFTAHGRYPTNTPGWWGGAHPFALLDYTVVHNGEISSYDANRRYIEMFGYKCTLLTDTEVIAYMIDYLNRIQKLSWRELASVIAAPFWSVIDKMPEKQKKELVYLRNMYASFLITGPFSILVGFEGGLMALNDRLKLRSMVVAEKGDMFYASSEECGIRKIEPNPDKVWAPLGGEPVIATFEGVK